MQRLTHEEIESRLKAIGFDLNNVPERLLDPVTMEFPLENPVFCTDGRTYNLSSFSKIITTTGLSASNSQELIKIKDNDDIFDEIEDFISAQEFKYDKAQRASINVPPPLKSFSLFPVPVKISPYYASNAPYASYGQFRKERQEKLHPMVFCTLL